MPPINAKRVGVKFYKDEIWKILVRFNLNIYLQIWLFKNIRNWHKILLDTLFYLDKT